MEALLEATHAVGSGAALALEVSIQLIHVDDAIVAGSDRIDPTRGDR